jgi:hypothetical protein
LEEGHDKKKKARDMSNVLVQQRNLLAHFSMGWEA